MMKKLIALLMAALLALSAFACAETEMAEGADSDWYMAVLADEEISAALPYHAFADVNGDGVPVLIVTTTEDSFITDEDYGFVFLYRDGAPEKAMVFGGMGGEKFFCNADDHTLTYYSRLSGEEHIEVYEATESVGLANPWEEMTEEELTQTAGVTFGVPDGAENVVYRWLESETLAEMQFTLDGDEYCARIKPAALEAGQLENISGMYYAWENEESVAIGSCEGTIGQYMTGSEEWVELCQWYDAAPGLMYSLSVYSTDLDGLDLAAIAQTVYVPMQGDD